MRLCTNCYQITTGKPLFCNKCGRSYSTRLCPRQHVNPRAAQSCSQCGSKDLSTPQPKISFLLRPLVFMLGISPGLLFLIIAGIYLFFYVQKLLTDPNGLLPLMCIGLYLGLVLLLWMMLPVGLRRLLGRIAKFVFRGKNKEGHEKH
jgi:hypothetical protein